MEPYPKPKLTGSTWISEDLLAEVLKRLPVKSLCRFRCVCKCWNSLITSPFLVNLHHSVTCSSTTPPHLKPYLQIPYFRVFPEERYYDSYALCSGILNSGHHLTHGIHLPFQLEEVTRSNFTHEEACFHPLFVDVVRGVVCLTSSLYSRFDYTILWNPAIHKYLPLPLLTLPSHLHTAIADFAHVKHFPETVRFDCHAIGFGYDTCKNDFKVVRLWIPPSPHVFPSCPPLQPVYEVYSPRQGLWRVAIAHIIQPCVIDFSKSRTGCFVNGTIHWLVTRCGARNDYVLMFECEREEFTTVQLPPDIHPPEGRNYMCNTIELLEYGGMLCALSKPQWENNRIDMWGMEEHGSWKKLFRIDTGEYDVIDLYQPSLDKLSPYGPSQWADFFIRPDFRFEQILSGRVYEETMFLMDDTKAHSYAEDEIVSNQISPTLQTCPKVIGMEDATFGSPNISDVSSEELCERRII